VIEVLLLTNEQIEKRFLFDLEMGRFKRENNPNCIRITFQGNVNYDKFIKCLEDLGYKDYYKELLETGELKWWKRNKNPRTFYVNLYPEEKQFLKSESYNYKSDYPNANQIPDYIKEYDLID